MRGAGGPVTLNIQSFSKISKLPSIYLDGYRDTFEDFHRIFERVGGASLGVAGAASEHQGVFFYVKNDKAIACIQNAENVY